VTRLLHHWLRDQAEARPRSIAVAMGEQTLDYGDLDRSSSQLAHLLREAGVRRGDRLGLALDKSPTAITAILAVLKADAVYVPLDVASPPARLARILRVAEPRLSLVDARGGRMLSSLRSEEEGGDARPVVWLDKEPVTLQGLEVCGRLQDLDALPVTAPEEANRADDAAHILFTSGSTGLPKGVVIRHSSVVRFIEWAVSHFGIGPDDRVSQHSPLHFDLSTLDIYGSLAAGAELHLVPPALSLLPHRLADFIRSASLTQWFSVPSLLTYMARFDVLSPGDFPSLRRLLWCGEVMPTTTLVHWMARLPHVAFTNLYGPTETTIASSFHTLREPPADERAPIPIGRPCPGEELLVLGPDLGPVPAGEVGEIFIRGVGVSPGYFRDPERTEAAFIPDPGSAEPGSRIYRTGDLGRVDEDGLFYFVGRADTQVKSRGYRIELGEVESALATLTYLRESAVVAVADDGFAGATLCCGYVSPDLAVCPSSIRKDLVRLLPPYMLPARFRRYEGLPRNANGKIDRRGLQEAFARDGGDA